MQQEAVAGGHVYAMYKWLLAVYSKTFEWN